MSERKITDIIIPPPRIMWWDDEKPPGVYGDQSDNPNMPNLDADMEAARPARGPTS